MHARSLSAAAATAALAALTGSVHAGIVMDSILRMDTGAGLIDIEFPAADPFTDLASIDDPAIGSSLLVEASVPDISAFTSGVEFGAASGSEAIFLSTNGGFLAPWHLGEYDFGFVASRLAVGSRFGAVVTLLGTLSTTGSGAGFFDLGGDIRDLALFAAGPVSYTTTLGPGMREIAWGSIIGNEGGSAVFTGTVTISFIPGPGSMALFAIAGTIGRARRRR